MATAMPLWAQPAPGAGAGAGASGSASRAHVALMRRELDAAETLLHRRLADLPPDSPIQVLRDADRITLRIPVSLLFDPDSTQLRPDAAREPALRAVIDVLRRRYRLVGQVNVYTDGIGGEIANHGLTEQRSLALLTALHSPRIEPTRLTGAGLGAANEISSDATPEGREQNRRVEIVFSLPAPPAAAAAPR